MGNLVTLTAPITTKGACLNCPSFCSKCNLVGDIASCVSGSCYNGYFEERNNDGVLTCLSCMTNVIDSRNILRCENKNLVT